MRAISAHEFRQNSKANLDKVRITREPVVIVTYGVKIAGIVPVKWAEALDQVTQFDTCGIDHEVLRTDLKQVFERALLEISTNPQTTLIELIQKLVEDATTVQRYHNMRKNLQL